MNRVVTALLLLGIVLVFSVSLMFGASRSDGGPGEKFGGTDSAVGEMLEEQGHEPWFTPLFEPDSGEIESGIFAAQAAMGGGFLGYCIGALGSRNRSRREHELDSSHVATASAGGATRATGNPSA
ncbi:energy-coupling factor ABC transporter substrate-binding protein [Gephyromycinifex aptenodytis]|uniref:energy-coupling factor ABC transporter substrate-binding protein n=1 Tax=Gephyromycinifex aptenodytis TaxID=2716227 RepID=UPI001444CE88|nr:energy-coupling factor ABC transporter substrate-binding protein [Gephyromycinifex aptenodytis]